MIVLLIAFTLVVKIAVAVMMGPDPVVVDSVMLIVSDEFTLVGAVKIAVMLNIVKLMIVLTLYKLAAPWLLLKLIIFVIGPVRLRVAVICLIWPNVWIGSVMHESAIEIHIKAFPDSLLDLVLFPA